MKQFITTLVLSMLALAFLSFPAPTGTRGIASCWDSSSGYLQNIPLEAQLMQGVQDEAFQKSVGEYRAFLMQLQADALSNRAAIRQMYGLDDGSFRPQIYSAAAMPTIVPFDPLNSYSIFPAPQMQQMQMGNQLLTSNQLFH